MHVTEENFMLLAAQHYNGNLSGGVEEFNDDLKRLHYIKRLLRRFTRASDVPERLLLNHFIVLYNTFGPFGNVMLWYKMPEYQSYIKPFAEFLNQLPPVIHINGVDIITSNIESDAGILALLERI